MLYTFLRTMLLPVFVSFLGGFPIALKMNAKRSNERIDLFSVLHVTALRWWPERPTDQDGESGTRRR